MLNLDLIDALYKQLSKQQKQELISILFKKSRQSMSYFHRTKDISLSKLETMADFFHLPLDYFRLGNEAAASLVKGYEYKEVDPNTKKTSAVFDNLLTENKILRAELERLEELSASRQKLLEAKQEVLNTKDQLIQLLTNSMANKAE